MSSFRASFGARYSGLLRHGVRSAYALSNRLVNPPAALPTRSLRRASTMSTRPELIDPDWRIDLPADRFERSWTNYGQGLAYGWGHWFITQRHSVHRVPDSSDFRSFMDPVEHAYNDVVADFAEVWVTTI